MYAVLAGLACTPTSGLCLKADVGACVLILELGEGEVEAVGSEAHV